ncbi:response regulator [Palleronia sp. KMU-117]|uniref:response regulator n=1 Tax=Palleronia sp. KMU-117 TaxID=3434108 RepID=UPI003D752A05
MKVLVVEDEDILRSLWVEVFEGAGHVVHAAADATGARLLLMGGSYDVVVLDLHLGEESGLSVATLATYANPDCKVVMITGSGLFAKGELFEIAPSVAAVLRKPVGIDELLAISEHNAMA